MMTSITRSQIRATLSSQVRRLRLRLGWSQLDLAETIGVSRATVNRIERGHHTPDVHTVYHLADVLGVTADTLITRHSA